jgi:hypothetical protein
MFNLTNFSNIKNKELYVNNISYSLYDTDEHGKIYYKVKQD